MSRFHRDALPHGYTPTKSKNLTSKTSNPKQTLTYYKIKPKKRKGLDML
jgi:hypothetical protein